VGSIFVTHFGPDAQSEDVLLAPREPPKPLECSGHLTLVVDPFVCGILEARLKGWAMESSQRGCEAALRPASVSDYVGCNAKQPRQDFLWWQHLVPIPPSFHKDNGQRVFSDDPATDSSEAVVVNHLGVPLEEVSEGFAIAGP
jgi:hypothetical protein